MNKSYPELPISFEIALEIVNNAVFRQTARHLKNIEVSVLQGTWLGQSYDEIAESVGYAPEYIKHDVGPKLWKILSKSLGEKVNKNNIIAVLIQKASQINSPNDSVTTNPVITESVTGVIPLDSPWYIERYPVESLCYEEIMRPGALIRLKAPTQMGKTSLMIRILHQAQQRCSENQITLIPLSLQRADKSVFTDLDRFLRWFCASIARKLRLSTAVDDYWSDVFGSKSNCTAYLEDCVLSELDGVLILALDQVDEVFLHPEIADDFFTLLRSWYEEAAYGESGNPLWQNLRLIIVHSTEVYIPLDINKSPFNVGLAIELHPFSVTQVEDLAQRYGLSLSPSELEELMGFIAGHPYLTQKAFYYLASQSLSREQLLSTSATDAGVYHHHLHRLLQSLQENSSLRDAYSSVVHSSNPVQLEQLLAFQLHSMGLVILRGNLVVPSCELYRQYFSRSLE